MEDSTLGVRWPETDPGKHWEYILWMKFALDQAGDIMEQHTDWIDRGDDRVFKLERQVQELLKANNLLQRQIDILHNKMRTLESA